MASIWKHPKSANWIGRYRGPEGHTINRSTGVRDEAEARRIAESRQIDAAREREAKTRDVSAGGIHDAVGRAERLAREGRLDAAAAREIVNDLLAAAGQTGIAAVTNRKWLDQWIAKKTKEVKPPSLVKYKQMANDWLNFLGRAADQPLETGTQNDVVRFRNRQITEGLSPRTVLHTLKIVRGAYQDAVEAGHLGRNPFVGIAVRIDEDDESTKRVPFTRSEVGKLVEHAKGDWLGMVLLGATTGLRLMDAARLKWNALNLDEKSMRVKTAKTGATLNLPIHGLFLAWLKKQTRGIGAAPVFPTLADKSGAGKSGLSSAFRRLMERAGVDAGIARAAVKGARGRNTSRKSFHSLRHFAASQLAAAGVRADIARQITGHLDAASHTGYVTGDLDALRGAMKSISIG